MKKIGWVLVALAVVVLIIMNATTGHFAYVDNDGCSCVVGYTAGSQKNECELSREAQCEAHWVNQALLVLGRFDLRK